MKDRIKEIFEESRAVKQETLTQNVELIVEAVEMIIHSLKSHGKILFFGNGGSAADSQHVAAEFIGRFQKERRALAAIAQQRRLAGNGELWIYGVTPKLHIVLEWADILTVAVDAAFADINLATPFDRVCFGWNVLQVG